MGVYDGHGGPACAQVISKRLLNYVAATLLPLNDLKKYITDESRENLLDTINDRVSIYLQKNILRIFLDFLLKLQIFACI